MFGDMSIGEIAQRLGRLGYDGVELVGDPSLYSASEAAAVLNDQGLEVFSLTPDNVDLAHPDPEVRAEAVDYYLTLIDFAAALGKPTVSCHGYVGRVRPMASQAKEWDLLVDAVRGLAERAQVFHLRLAMEVLNRYESHLVNTSADALRFVQQVGCDNVGILLDAYHMNIEEPSPAEALRSAGAHLSLYHAADSNRQALGRGHTDFGAQFDALDEIAYKGPVIMECTPPGPDPFTAIKDEHSLHWLETYLKESRSYLLEAWK
jgi:sugar phosphate isomerase/epimerase